MNQLLSKIDILRVSFDQKLVTPGVDLNLERLTDFIQIVVVMAKQCLSERQVLERYVFHGL